MSGTESSPAMRAIRAMLSIPPADASWARAADETRLMGWMLAATRPWPEAAATTMRALSEAHRVDAADEALWRRLRREAVELADSPDRTLGLLGQVAEAAAWPVASSNAGLTEVMGALCQLKSWRAAAATGWTEADDVETIGILTAISGGQGGVAPTRDEIPGLFAAAHPQLERRFTAQLKASNMAFTSCRAEIAAWIAGASR